MHSANNKTEKWKLFLNSLFDEFSEYEIQKKINRFNTRSSEDWVDLEKPQDITVNKNTFKRFLNLLGPYNITAYNDIKELDITNSQLDELNHLLRITLKYGVTESCSATNDLVIRGYFVKLSDFLDNDSSIDQHNECGNVRSTKIFALNTIFIDRHIIQRNYKIDITIISPKWKIIGNRSINLNGSDGDSYETDAPEVFGKSQRGRDGESGKPGKPGGTFFGIGEHFVNGKNLKITANGGNGGKGQNGGNGTDGADGVHAILETDQARCFEDMCKNQLRGYDHTFKCSLLYFFETMDVYLCDILVFGKPGGKGGDGGNGGSGGEGGIPGNVILVELDNASEIFKSSLIGNDGVGGSGGSGGMGGINGDDVYMSYQTYSKWYRLSVKFNERRNNTGTRGMDGHNILRFSKPASVTFQPATVINEYKHYLLENLDESLLSAKLKLFLTQMNINVDIKHSYNTLGLVNELKIMEEQYHKLHKIVNLAPFYQSLLNRVSEYAENPTRLEHSIEYKKILSYLYSAILSKIYNLKNNCETNLIININDHLDIVINDIEILKNIQEVRNKVDIISKYKKSYKNGINQKIRDVSYFIDSQIMPEMREIFSEIDNQIELLINDTIALQEKANEEKHRLVEKKKDLEKALELRGLFSGLKIVGQVVSFLGPVGAVAGSVIGLSGVTSEYLMLDNQINQEPLLKLPASVTTSIRSLAEQFKNAKHRKIVKLNRLIEDISQEINKFPDKLSNTSSKIIDIKARLKNINNNDLDGIRILENELKRELKVREGELKVQKIEADQRTANALAVIEKCYLVTQLAALGFDVYNKYKSDDVKLEAINTSIGQSAEKFNKLKKYEEVIEDIIVPMLDNLEVNIYDITKKLGTKSQVHLDITKWQIQDSLKNISHQLGKLTKGFEEKDELLHYIEKLQDIMTTLITVYDRLQYYQEQQNLVVYIADISSVAARSIDITNSALYDAQSHLEILIRSNLVLRQYNTGIEAFKKFVFPLAHLYLRETMLPSYLQSDTSLENLVFESVKKINNLKSKIHEYKSYLNGSGYNPYIMVGEFNSQHFSTEPFFVWKSEEYKDEISNLLSGEKVLITADVNRSLHEDAVKFRIAEFHFKSQNASIQSEIDNILKGFEVVATHLGNSYYRCGNEIYIIVSNSTTISYYLEKKPDGQPIRKSVTYVDIKNNDLILSPYATWEVVLMENTRKVTFHDLKKYKNKLDLELIGEGSYFDNRRVNFSDLMINQYYDSVGEEQKIHRKIVPYYPNSNQSARIKRQLKLDEETANSKQSNAISPSRNICTRNKTFFPWLNLPKFTIFPGAEGSPTQDRELYRGKHIFFNFVGGMLSEKHSNESEKYRIVEKIINRANRLVDFVKIPYIKAVKFVKNLSTNGTRLNARIIPSDSTTQQNNYIGFIETKSSSKLSEKLSLNFSYKNDSVVDCETDLMNSLTLVCLLIKKICGTNIPLNNTYYVSPEQLRITKIYELEKEILPTLQNHYEDKSIENNIVNDGK